MLLTGKTALFGGSFNPPHMGHQFACLYMLEGLGAQAVWLVPTFRHPFGKVLEAYEHRLQMCRLMARPFADRVVVDDVERRLGGDGRTIDLLTHLLAREPERQFHLVIGADVSKETASWHKWDEITKMVPVLIIGRGGIDAERSTPIALPSLSSTDVREKLRQHDDVSGLVPQSVFAYIQEHRLYG